MGFFSEAKKTSSEIAIAVEKEIKQTMDQHLEQIVQQIKQENQNAEGFASISGALERLEAPAIVEMRPEHNQLMTDNPLATENYLKTNEGTIQTENDLVVRLTENPTLAKVLTERKFDLADPAIAVRNSAESSLFFDTAADFKTISLGNAPVMPKNTVFIGDVDPHSIPKNLDISIFKEDKEFVVVGKAVEIGEGETEAEIKANRGRLEVIDQDVFVEETLKDVQRKELALLEQLLISLNPLTFLWMCLKVLPLAVFVFYVIKSYAEVRKVELATHQIDERRVAALVQLKKKYSN